MHDAFLEVTLAVKDAAAKLFPGSSSLQTKSVVPETRHTAVVNDTPKLRSSNLRVKKEFTDRDKNKFLIDAFEYIANYFEGSLNELKARNENIETDFRRIDANRFMATIYSKGKEVNKCNIWLGDGGAFSSGIPYSTGSFRDGSYNESLNVENDGYSMYLKSMGMQFHRQNTEEKMTFEGGAEYYWSMFIERLQ
jgi:hypothetical protein